MPLPPSRLLVTQMHPLEFGKHHCFHSVPLEFSPGDEYGYSGSCCPLAHGCRCRCNLPSTACPSPGMYTHCSYIGACTSIPGHSHLCKCMFTTWFSALQKSESLHILPLAPGLFFCMVTQIERLWVLSSSCFSSLVSWGPRDLVFTLCFLYDKPAGMMITG